MLAWSAIVAGMDILPGTDTLNWQNDEPEKYWPLIVINVPPLAWIMVGETDVTTGAGDKRIDKPLLVRTEPSPTEISTYTGCDCR